MLPIMRQHQEELETNRRRKDWQLQDNPRCRSLI